MRLSQLKAVQYFLKTLGKDIRNTNIKLVSQNIHVSRIKKIINKSDYFWNTILVYITIYMCWNLIWLGYLKNINDDAFQEKNSNEQYKNYKNAFQLKLWESLLRELVLGRFTRGGKYSGANKAPLFKTMKQICHSGLLVILKVE